MSKIQKDILFWTGLILSLFLVIFLAISANQKLKTAATTNTVSFNGDGKVLAKPDVAVIDFAVVTESDDSKSAQDQNSVKSKTVSDFLKKQGVDDKDISTTSYNIFPQYGYPQYDKPQIRGYQVNQTMEVKVRNLDGVSKILDGLVGAGVNQVNNLQFKIDDPEKLMAQARTKAIADTKDKAKELEAELGVKLGKIVNFSENSSGLPVPLYGLDKGGGVGYGGGGPSLPVGENEITISVVVTYQIK